jgi:hypothetical protein
MREARLRHLRAPAAERSRNAPTFVGSGVAPR